MTNNPFLNAKHLTDEMLREQWVSDLNFAEMVLQCCPFLFNNLNNFLFQFSADEHTNSNENYISYDQGSFYKRDNIIYVKNTETKRFYIVTDINYQTLLLTAIEYYINSYKCFSVEKHQFMTFNLLEFLNNMKNQDELVTRIENSNFFQDVGPLSLIRGYIFFFEQVSYTDLDEYLDCDSLIVKKNFLIW